MGNLFLDVYLVGITIIAAVFFIWLLMSMRKKTPSRYRVIREHKPSKPIRVIGESETRMSLHMSDSPNTILLLDMGPPKFSGSQIEIVAAARRKKCDDDDDVLERHRRDIAGGDCDLDVTRHCTGSKHNGFSSNNDSGSDNSGSSDSCSSD